MNDKEAAIRDATQKHLDSIRTNLMPGMEGAAILDFHAGFDAGMSDDLITLPVRYDKEFRYIFDADDKPLAELATHGGQHIANCINEHTTLRDRVTALTAENERLREENRMVLSPEDEANLIECVTDELCVLLGDEADDPIPSGIAEVIRDWLLVRGEDQTSGMPEYENHRY